MSLKRVQIKIKCTNKKQYLLNGECLTESIVHQPKFMANVPGYKEKVYLGVSETTFTSKNRLQNNVKKIIQYGTIQGVLEDKTPQRNTLNKVECIKEMKCV